MTFFCDWLTFMSNSIIIAPVCKVTTETLLWLFEDSEQVSSLLCIFC